MARKPPPLSPAESTPRRTASRRTGLRGATPSRISDDGSESAVNALIGVTAQNVEGDLRKFATELQHRFSERTAQLVAERDFVSGLLDTVDAAIYVLDRDARIIGVNAEFEKLSGYTFAEVKGKTLLETVVPSDEAAAFNDYFARILASQAAHRREGSWVRKNGSRLWISSSEGRLWTRSGSRPALSSSGGRSPSG